MVRFPRRTCLLGLTLLILAGWPVSFPAQGQAGAIPSRILLGWSADPATSRAVTWRTAESVAEPRAEIAVAPAGPVISKIATRVVARAARIDLGAGSSVYHYIARLEGLEPATRYVYRVGGGTAWSEWFEFVTASRTRAPFRFIYLGDAQNGLDDVWPRTVRAAYARAPDARLIVFTGDLVAEGYDDRLWDQWTAGLGFIAASMPLVPAPGNHDERRAPGSADPERVMAVSSLWRARFALPANGLMVPGVAGQNYWLDYQGVRFITIDVNPFAKENYVEAERVKVQRAVLAWLESALARNPNPWTIVVQHQPLYAVAKDRDFPLMRSLLGPLYDRHHVDLVLEGHDHVYARTHKVFAGRVVGASEPGTIYAISVSGSKMYATTSRHAALMAKSLDQTQLHQIIAVDGHRLVYESYAADGRRVDAFELIKTDIGSIYRPAGDAK